jgi:(p)ppGpp synthase/HD superfamily hydrolase
MLKLFLTERYVTALRYAFDKHKTQLRKGSGVPYMTHLMSVSALVMENGGGEDEAIGALLHDAVEDQGVTVDEIRVVFGDRVADIVAGCTKPKVDWKHVPADKVWETMHAGHLKYFEHLRSSFDPIRLVSACDKLHNARSILHDLQAGRNIFAKMKGGPGGTLWYYQQMASIFLQYGPIGVGKALAEVNYSIAGFVPVDLRFAADGLTPLTVKSK